MVKEEISAAGHIRLPQDTETPLATLSTRFGTVLYLYARSSDSVVNATIGQDYLTFRYSESDLAFAVCDGVGQSFMGDLAARIVGDGLTGWLWAIERPQSAERFSEAVTEALNALTGEGQQQVKGFELPAHLPPLVRQALEMQRDYGSESMFVAGRLHLAGPDPWIALCWLGDSPVAAIDIDGQLVDLGPKGHTSERWSTHQGVKGTVHTWVGSAHNVARVAGYTDGLSVDGVPTDETLVRLMTLWQSAPPLDDASLFDIRLAPSPATTGAPALPAGTGEGREAAPPEVFRRDEARPIVVEESELRTPLAGLEPIEATPPDGPTVESWRPLSAGMGDEQKAGTGERGRTISDLPPATRQQIQVWQQAALLGLTSAALAMLMVERLLSDLERDDGGLPGKSGGQDT
ncbi:MAG TPA: hypothetical protein ENI95_13060 [Chloroflexi bacterium]|nr:hypothetical protein [Chloroflexota bacterium]